MVDLDWDAWRANYDQMTFAEQQAFYKQVAELYPHQESANVAVCEEAFSLIDCPQKFVIELGGWNGRLASHMINKQGVGQWWNFDIVDVPQATTNPAYHQVILEDWLWNGGVEMTAFPEGFPATWVFVACHTIEHLSVAHLDALIDWITESNISWVYFEAPLPEEIPPDWTGYAGSHALNMGWGGVEMLLGNYDYKRVPMSTTAAGLWRRG